MKPQPFTTEDTEKRIFNFLKTLSARWLLLLKMPKDNKRTNTMRAQRGQDSDFLLIIFELFSVSSVVNY